SLRGAQKPGDGAVYSCGTLEGPGVADEVTPQVVLVSGQIPTQCDVEPLTEPVQDRAERHVQDLPDVEVVEQARQRCIGHAFCVRRRPDPSRHVVCGSVTPIPTPGELVDLPEQPWGSPRQRAQSFQIAGACGLHVPKAARPTTECAVDGQLVRARVQAQFVRPETAGDPRV